MTIRTLLGAFVYVALSASSAGCGPDGPPPAVPTPVVSASSSATTSEVRHDLPDGHTRVGSAKLLDRRHRTGLAPDTLDQVQGTSRPPQTATEIYKSAAPATVIVRVGEGLGSGIIVGPEGWVLTNHHVIKSGEATDFKYKATILLGELSKESGAMERTKQEYEAEVYKADKLRDIALLKIVDPPKDLPYVKLAAENPLPGGSVVALGHAGVGMLWALKSGQISALGKLADHLAQSVSFKDDESGKKAFAKFKEFVEGHNLGMIIQSTCNILPGDSGGPLLNDRGELIGLNVFSRRDRKTGGLLSFHVHRAEIAKFMKTKPAHPGRLLPDPWLEGGADLSYADADLDGKVDALMMQGRKPCNFCPRQSSAVMIDVDQNSYAGRQLPDLNDVFAKRDIDAEAIYLQIERNVFVWYDTDDDGHFDVLLYDERMRGRAKAGYRVAKDGKLTRDDELTGKRPLTAALFEGASQSAAFARISRAAFPDRYVDAPKPLEDTLPSPIGNTGIGAHMDINHDGKPDALAVTGAFSKRMLVDLDDNFVSKLPSKDVKMATLDKSKVDAEIAVVSQGTHMWVYYDRDDDGRYDLVLHAPGSRVYVAASAWTLAADGTRTAAPEHLGRKVMRPALINTKSQSEALRKLAGRGLFRIMSARDNDALASFPHPVDDHRGAGMDLMDTPKAPRSVVTLVGFGSDGYLVDLDRNSGLFGPLKSLKINKRVADGKFDTEFAYFHRNGVALSYYDVDRSPGYDIVLVSTKSSSGVVDAGFRINGEAATFDPALVGGKLVRPSLFSSTLLKARLKALAPTLFTPVMIEP